MQSLYPGSKLSCCSTQLNHADWRNGNRPLFMLHEDDSRRDAVILIHGLCASPYYVEEIGKKLYEDGFDVVAPMLPGHGLLDPDAAFEDDNLLDKWIVHIQDVVAWVRTFSDRIIIGGHSAGASIALNMVLTTDKPFAGLLMLAPAIDMYYTDNLISALPFAQSIAEYLDGEYKTGSRYKHAYSTVAKAGAVQVVELIRRNASVMKTVRIPVLAITSSADDRVDPLATLQFVRKQCLDGRSVCLSHPDLTHGNLSISDENPMFNDVLDAVVSFVRKPTSH
jgi:esterase/lipase